MEFDMVINYILIYVYQRWSEYTIYYTRRWWSIDRPDRY
jgi:hypothetical protein